MLSTVRDFVREKVADERLRTRLEGVLQRLNELRPDDRLYYLRNRDFVSGKYIRAWRTMRNRQVHPEHRDLSDATDADYQRLFDLVHQTTVLLYCIVFHLIGYRGKYVDYGTHGYPVRDYPGPVT